MTDPTSVSQVFVIPLGDEQANLNTAIISMVGTVKNRAVLMGFFIDLYNYLRDHEGDPTGFKFPPTQEPPAIVPKRYRVKDGTTARIRSTPEILPTNTVGYLVAGKEIVCTGLYADWIGYEGGWVHRSLLIEVL